MIQKKLNKNIILKIKQNKKARFLLPSLFVLVLFAEILIQLKVSLEADSTVEEYTPLAQTFVVAADSCATTNT